MNHNLQENASNPCLHGNKQSQQTPPAIYLADIYIRCHGVLLPGARRISL